MALTERLRELVAACFPGIWVQSAEHDDAVSEVTDLCRRENWSLGTWDLDRGLALDGQEAQPGTNDPLAAIKSLPGLATPDGTSLLVLRNYHRFLGSAEIVQALDTAISRGKQDRTFVVILSPVINLPVELERHFVVVQHDLPGREQLHQIARGLATEPGELPEGADLDRVLDAAAGLTRMEVEGAFSLSLIRHGTLQPDAVWQLKSGMLQKSGLLTLHRGTESFADLGGLEALKAFTKRALNSPRRGSGVRPKGLLLLSPPGCGKSQFCKALGNEVGRPTLVLDVGSLMGSLVGQTEERTRQALKVIDAMAPCVVFIDEVEKALSGSSGQTDSGVSARMMGSLLSWLNDHESDVFVVCTANDVSKLPPEFSRAERWDGTFFLDLPRRQERQAIWQIYLARYGLDPDQPRPNDEGWTGAEIKSACRLAALLDVPLAEAAQNVVPIAVTAAESVERLRNWASGRCLSADHPGIYTRNACGSNPPGLLLNPSLN